MNKNIIAGFVVGAIFATAGGAFALRDNSPKTADIISVKPITLGMEQEYIEITSVTLQPDPSGLKMAKVISASPVTEPGKLREVCEDRIVTHQVQAKDEHQIAGTATGAVIGGLLGNQVGGGDGKKAATVLGAIVGGVVGKNVQNNKQKQQTYQTTEQVCNTLRDEDKVSGYDVTFDVNGEVKTITMSYSPKDSLPVVDGTIVTDKTEIKKIQANSPPPIYDVGYLQNNQSKTIEMTSAPKIGARFPVEYGQILTKPEDIANLQSRLDRVIAFQVMYQSDAGVGQVRMEQPPTGSTLQLKHGKPVITAMQQ